MQNNSNEQYTPAEDTFFLDDHLRKQRGHSALDIGSGSGYLTQALQSSFSFVVGTDINYSVLKKQTYPTPNIICCSGADALNYTFDLIICNLPYLATDKILDVATDGGPEGLQVPTQIIKSAIPCLKKDGKFLFVTSSLSNYTELINIVRSQGLKARIISKKKLFFEELILVEAQK